MIVSIIGYSLLGLFAALLVFMIVRTALAKKKPSVPPAELVSVDKQEVTDLLVGAVRIPTVTPYTPDDDKSVFLAFHAFLEKSFPLIFARAEKTLINGYGLVLKLPGTDSSLRPGCFLAHQDVVPAPPEGWEVEPFSGVVKDGYIYGRGSQDMKSQLIASLFGMELYLREGKVPSRTLYYCFGFDEEFTGRQGAQKIAEYLDGQGIRFEFVVDEGGALTEGKMLGVKENLALIGTCEKGYADFKLTATRDGGHASAPKKRSSVDEICEAVSDLSRTPMKARWTKPFKLTVASLAPYTNPFLRFLFVNRDILGCILKPVMSVVNPMLNSEMRTTFAATQLQGSGAPNVIPPSATAVVNCRVNIGETTQMAKEHIQKVVGKKIKVDFCSMPFEPTPVSPTDTPTYKLLEKSIEETYRNTVAVPYPFIAASDSKWYYRVCDSVYRFTPILYTLDDQKRIHGLNERCSVDSMVTATQFYHRLISNM